VLPSGQRSRVTDIQILGRSLAAAEAEQSVTLLLADEIDISRGDMIVRRGQRPGSLNALVADICWLSERPLDPQRRYLLRHTTREVKAKVANIAHRVDVASGRTVDASGLAMNDIGRVSLRLGQPVFADPYERNRSTGAFILIDEATNDTVGAGMIRR